MSVPSTRAASFPLASTTSKLAEAPGSSAAMPTGVMEGSAATAALDRKVLRPLDLARQLDAHLVAHGVDEEIGDPSTHGLDHVRVDAGLVQRARHASSRIRASALAKPSAIVRSRCSCSCRTTASACSASGSSSILATQASSRRCRASARCQPSSAV